MPAEDPTVGERADPALSHPHRTASGEPTEERRADAHDAERERRRKLLQGSTSVVISTALAVVAVVALAFAVVVVVLRPQGISQRCFLATQLLVAEVPADEREPIPDSELERVCGEVVRFEIP